MPGRDISESYGSCLFSLVKNLLTVLHAGCSNLHSHQQFKRVLFAPHTFQPLLLVHFLIMVIWTGVRWYLIIVLICISLIIRGASLVAQMVKHLLTMRETQIQSLVWEDPLEKEMATHSSVLAWRIPWMEEPGGPQSMALQSQASFHVSVDQLYVFFREMLIYIFYPCLGWVVVWIFNFYIKLHKLFL